MPIQDIANTADVQIFGDAVLSADQAKFGTRSLKLDGDGDYIETGKAAEFDLSGDFTIEGWIYPTTLSGNNVIASLTADGVNFGIATSGSDSFLTAYRGATALTQSSGTQVATGAWQFVSFSRASDNLVISLDGVSVAQGTFATSGLSGNALRVGRGPLDSTGFAGFIDEFRVTKGNARYTSSSYSVPDNEFGGDSTMRARRRRLTVIDGIVPEVITIEVWGAGGGGKSTAGRGGGGGYTTAQYTIAGDQTLHILIGSGGDMGENGAVITSELEIGGGAGGARGGALTGVFTEPFSPLNVDNLHAAAVVIGGSGGGAAASNVGTPGKYGGQGGGSTGGDGTPQSPGPVPRGGSGHNSGLGGTQSAGGAGAQGYPFGHGPNAEDGGKLKGGASSGSFPPGETVSNGGGGAGYYGGGGGGSTGPSGNHGSGGGGSGYFEDDDNNLPSQLFYVANSGSTLGGADGAAPGATSGVSAGPSDAPPAYGFGGSGPGLGGGDNDGSGGPGYVVITRADGSKTNYSANGTFSLVS